MEGIKAWTRETASLFAYSLMRAGWAISFSLATFVPGHLYAGMLVAAGLALTSAGASLGVRLSGRAIAQAAAGATS